MGAVAIDIYRKETEFIPFTLNDENVLKYLILYRNKLDGGYSSCINLNINQAGDSFDFNVELIALYTDLDNQIKRANLNDKEKLLLEFLFDGLDLADVPYVTKTFSESDNIDNAQRNVRRVFERIIEKIRKEY